MPFIKRNIDREHRNGMNTTTIIKYVSTIEGQPGSSGEDAFNVYITPNSHVFEGTAVAAKDGQTDRINVFGFRGNTQLDTYIDTITGTVPEAIEATVQYNGTNQTYIDIAVSHLLTESSGELHIPVKVNVNMYDSSTAYDSSLWDPTEGYQYMTFDMIYSWAIAKEATAVNAYRMDLDNQNATVNCDSSGNVLAGAVAPTCKATLYFGETEAVGARYEASLPTDRGLTGLSFDSSGNLVIDMSTLAFEGNSIEIPVHGLVGVNTMGTAVFTLNKNIPGSAGEDAVSYWLALSADKIKKNTSTTQTYTPSTITATGMKQVGAQTPVEATECVIKYGIDTDNPTTTYTSAISSSSATNFITVGLYLNGVQRDLETIPVLEDGKDGSSPYMLDLSNENASINADANQNILRNAQRPTCKATLTFNGIELSGVTYSMTKASSTTGVSINGSTGQLTFNAGSNSTPFNFSGFSTELSITARYNNVTYGPVIMSISKNLPGEAGTSVTVTSTKIEYKEHSSGTSAPAGTWSTTIPTVRPGYYLWTRTTVTYSDGQQSISYSVSYTAKDGAAGEGKGIQNTEIRYARGTSGTTPPTSGWQSSIPSLNSGDYLWTRTTLLFTDSTTAVSYSVTRWGVDGNPGDSGADAVSYWLDLSANSVLVDVNNNYTCTPSTITVKAYKQSGENTPEQIQYSTGTPRIILKYSYDQESTEYSGYDLMTNSNTITVGTNNGSRKYISVSLWVNHYRRDIETIPLTPCGANGAQGVDGFPGCVYRRSVWLEGVNYKNDAARQPRDENDIRYIDVVFDKDIALITPGNVSNVHCYMCKQSHYSNITNKPGTSSGNAYWQEISINSEPSYTPLLLAHQISADLIDVSNLKVTELADIDSLVVKQIDSKNHNFKIDADGYMVAAGGTFDGYLFTTFQDIPTAGYQSSGYTINLTDNYFNLRQTSTGQQCKINLPNNASFIGKTVNIYSPVVYTSVNEGANMLTVTTVSNNSYILNVRKMNSTAYPPANHGYGACRSLKFKGGFASFLCVEGSSRSNVNWVLTSGNDSILYSKFEMESGFGSTLGTKHNGAILLQGIVSMNSSWPTASSSTIYHPSITSGYISEFGIDSEQVNYTYTASGSVVTIDWTNSGVYSEHIDIATPISDSTSAALKTVTAIRTGSTLKAQFKIYDGSWSTGNSKWCSFYYTIYAV